MSSYNSSRPIRSGGFSSDGGCSDVAACSRSARGNVASTGRITTRLPSPAVYRFSNKSSTGSLCSASNNIRTSTSPSGNRTCRCSSTSVSLRSSRISSPSFSRNTISIIRSIAVSSFPLPVPDFRYALAVFVNVLLVLDQLVLRHPLQVGPLAPNCSIELCPSVCSGDGFCSSVPSVSADSRRSNCASISASNFS